MSIECPVCHEDAHFYCLAQGTIAAVLYSANEDGEQDYEIDGELEEFYDSTKLVGPFQCSECGATFDTIREIA